MPRLLIVSPHFPPTDAVDMHRVRMNVGYYRDFGWEPIVLSVEPKSAGRLIEPDLVHAVSAEVQVFRTGAFPETLTRMLGFGALGLRAYNRLESAGARIIRQLKPDLAFFSTTCFPVMTLGARWRRRFGLPYVLDMQDPWFTAPATTLPFHGRGLKARTMRLLSRGMERAAMQSAAGLISVSADYLPPLRAVYPNLRGAPCEVIPFGHEAHDLQVARQYGKPVAFEFSAGPGSIGLYAGRAGADMNLAFRALFAVIAAGLAQRSTEIARLRLAFLGTSYQLANGHSQVQPLAAEAGVEDRVAERPGRVSLLDAQRALAEADFLLITGSADLAYQPSKLFQYLATDRPVLCVAPMAGQFARTVQGLDSVFMVATDAKPETLVAPLSAWLTRFAGRGVEISGRRRDLIDQYSARALAGRECEVFDRALAGQKDVAGQVR